MDKNPWAVDSIKDFWFLICPECDFKAKEENCFLHHANEEHSLSWILLEKSVEMEFSYKKCCGNMFRIIMNK